MSMNKHDVTTALATISYEIESKSYVLSQENWQRSVFLQVEKDANMVGIHFKLNESGLLEDWYVDLKHLLTHLLMEGDVRSFLYRIDVSEKKIQQIQNLSIDDLCMLVLEREFKKVCIRKHFSENS